MIQKEYQVNNFVRLFINTNNNDCVKITRQNRRYSIYQFKKLEDKETIDKMDDIYDNKKIIYLMGEYLMNYKLKKEQYKRTWWEKHIPKTAGYKLFYYNDPVSLFIKDMYMCGDYFRQINNRPWKPVEDKPNLIRIPNPKMYPNYKEFCSENNTTAKTKNNFRKAIQSDFQFIDCDKKIGKKNYYEIDLEKVNKYMEIEEEFINHYDDIDTDDEGDYLIYPMKSDDDEEEIVKPKKIKKGIEKYM